MTFRTRLSGSDLPNILILDDDASFLRACDSSLSSRFNVISARTPIEAAALFETQKFAATIVDYWLGVETAEEFLDLAQASSPCIVVSGDANKEVAIKLLNRRVFGLLEKPIQFDALIQAIDRAIDTHTEPVSKANRRSVAKHLLKIDPQSRRVQIEERIVRLTPSEMKILTMLIEAEGATVHRDTFIRAIWGRLQVSRSALDTHILNLKKKLPLIESHLHSVYGSGYILDSTHFTFSMQNVPF